MAAARLAKARDLVNAFAEERDVPVENLLTPDYLRRVLWKPPRAPTATTTMEAAVAEELPASAPAPGRSRSPRR